jgi:predicted DNA-binding transcriptional regulator AlpA
MQTLATTNTRIKGGSLLDKYSLPKQELKSFGTLADRRIVKHTPTQSKPGLMSYKRVQSYLDMSKDQLYELRNEDPDFPAMIKIRGRLYTTQAELDAFIEKKAHDQLLGITEPGNR